ncbi:MAG: cysteine-rich CWC family protein [Bacteroidetes bacterium]|nr:cysteine-rich CWC family protein [Bacteroidota bacterium]
MHPKHEEKTCPRCQKPFECKVGNIAECQCYGINFSEAEKEYIDAQFEDCICRECLLELKEKSKPIADKE